MRLVDAIACGLVLGAAATIVARSQPANALPAVLYEGARLIIGDERAPIEAGTFLVQNGRISAVGPKGAVTAPRGGFVLWVQLPANVDSLDLFKRALPAGITLAPGYLFSATAKYCNYIRLNAAHMDFAAERALRQLGKLASQSQQRVA